MAFGGGRPHPKALPPLPPSDPKGPLVALGEGRGEGALTALITSAQLFQGARELHIDHHGAVYRLKQTALGKLILTK